MLEVRTEGRGGRRRRQAQAARGAEKSALTTFSADACDAVHARMMRGVKRYIAVAETGTYVGRL